MRNAGWTTLVVLLVTACGCEQGPPRLSSPLSAAPRGGGDSVDPAAAGISEIARISRYVFREMSLRQTTCGALPVAPGRFDWTLRVEVKGGRVADVRLSNAAVVQGGLARPLASAEWPAGLRARVDCLSPYLRAMDMAPAPADGVYESRFLTGIEAGAPLHALPAHAPKQGAGAEAAR